MSSVDDRIVNMQFNNRQFAQGASESIKSLQGVEKAIAGTAKSKGMVGLEKSVGAVSMKFSAMQVAGVAALGTIVSKATSAGLSLLKSFTIAPIMQGFQEYQTGLNSIQTIMSNTGKSVKVVNKALDELNEYADQTIYNFSEMAKNVGTFTAAGVDLKTSVASIKGIANLAALSGSNSQQASTAMYQLSQAISAGKVGLQDWNSVVNAGMGGKIFQTALTRTAINMGNLTEGAVKFEGALKKLTVNGQSFRQSISAAAGQESYLTGEVLVETLKQIAGGYTIAELRAKGFSLSAAKDIDELARKAFDAATKIKTLPQLVGVIRESIGSTFAEAFRTIIGDFEQSKKLWGDVGYAIIGPHGFLTRIQDGFTDTLKGWADGGGRDKVLKGFKRLFYGLTSVVGAFTGAFTDIFPPATSNTLIALSGAFKRFALNLRPSKETLEDLRSIFGGVFSVLHIGFTILKGITGAFTNFFGALFSSSEGARGGVLSLLGSIGDILIAFDSWITSGGKLQNFLSGFGTVAGAFLSPVVAAIGLVVDGFAALVSGQGIGGAKEAFLQARDVFAGFVSDIVTGLDQITAPLDPLKAKIADFARKAVEPFEGLLDVLDRARVQIVEGLGLDRVMPTMDGFETVLDRIKNKISDFASNFSLASVPMEDFGNAIDYVVDKVNELVNSLDISGKIESIKTSVGGLFASLSGGGGSAASSGGAAMVASAEATGSAFAKVGDILQTVGNSIKTVLDLMGQAVAWIGSNLKGMFPNDPLEWATLLNVLISGALIKRLFFSKGAFGELASAIENIGGSIADSIGALTKTLKTLQTSIKAVTILNIALATALLVASLVALSFIPIEKLQVGLGAITATFAILAAMLFTISKIDASMDISVIAAGLVLIAGAVVLLTAAVAALGFLPMDVIEQGISGMAIVLALLTASLMGMSGLGGQVAAAGAAMVLMATAINILVVAVTALGLLPMATLQQGLGAIAIGIGMMTIALTALTGIGPSILAAGAAMVMMATAMDILVAAIVVLGLLPFEAVKQGLGAVAIGLGIMVGALLLLSSTGPASLAAGASMLMMAGALNILLSVILVLGTAPWSVVEQGLKGMAIALGILLAAGLLAMVVAPGLAALSSVITAIGIAMLAAGAGVFLFATGLAILAAAGVAAIGIIVLAIHAFIALLPSIALQMAAAFVTFLQAIALAAPKIRKAITTILKEMLGTVRDAIPEIQLLFQELLNAGIRTIRNTVPQFIEAGLYIIDQFLKAVDRHIPNIVDSAFKIVKNFVKEVGEGVVELAEAGKQMLIDTMNGLSAAIESGDEVRDAAWNLAKTFADEVREALWDLVPNIDMPDLPNPFKAAKDAITGDSRASSGMEDITRGFKTAFVDPLTKALAAAGAAVEAAVRNASVIFARGSTSGAVFTASQAASKEQSRANTSQSRADIQDKVADKAEREAAKKEKQANKAKGKEAKKKAERKAKKANEEAAKQRKASDRAQAAADKAQAAADAKAQQAIKAREFEEADLKGKGDFKADEATELSAKAQAALDAANAKAARADELEKQAAKLGKKDKKQAEKMRAEAKALRDQSKKDAQDASNLSASANQAYQDSKHFYDKARAEAAAAAALIISTGIQNIQDDIAAYLKAIADNKEFEAANDEGKAKLLTARAEANQAKADTANAAMQEALRQAELLKLSDPEKAEEWLKIAEEQAQIYMSANDQGQQERDQAAELIKQAAEAKKAVEDRIAAIKKSQKEEDEARAAEEEYEAAGTEKRAEIMEKRAAASQAEALAAKEAMARAMAEAERLAGTDTEGAMKQLDIAEEQARIAKEAADRAEQESDQAKELRQKLEDELNSGGAQDGGSGSGNNIQPSRTALEDAAKAVDRYTSSLAAAEAAAGATESVVQYIQNNQSPKALSASEVYRQTKNLLSAKEIKMGVPA